MLSPLSLLLACAVAWFATPATAAAAAAIDEFTITRLDAAFNSWFHDITAQFGSGVNQVEIRTTKRMGRGVYALKTVEGEAPLLKIPRDYIICVDTVQGSESALVYERVQKDSDKLTLFILEQKAKGAASKFAPWLAVMPREFGSPLFGTPEELLRLRGDSMYTEVVEELKVWEHQYDLLAASVLEKFPEVFPPGCCGFEDYKWARHMIESRAWHLRGKQHLAPMADFFNHEPLPSMTYDTEPDERGEAFLAHHHVAPAYVEVLADRQHRAEQQVFECYGDNSNSIYLKYHGFVPDENQYDCQEIVMPALKPSDADPLYQYRIRYLGQLGFRSPKSCVRNRADHFLKALNFVRVRAMTNDDLRECEAQEHAAVPLAERLGRCVLRAPSTEPLTSMLQARLDAYPTTVAEDVALLEQDGAGLTQIERWSVMYVLKRKTIIQALLDYVAQYDPQAGSSGSGGGKKKKKKKKRVAADEL